jgi:hypothetical protein
MAKQTRRTNTRRRRSSPIALPDEKSVRATDKTIGVKTSKVSRAREERIAPAAVDRRRQVIQTDEEMCETNACAPRARKRK